MMNFIVFYNVLDERGRFKQSSSCGVTTQDMIINNPGGTTHTPQVARTPESVLNEIKDLVKKYRDSKTSGWMKPGDETIEITSITKL